MYKLGAVFIFLFFTSISVLSDDLSVGLITDTFMEKKVNKKSFNDLILEMLVEEGIKVNVVKGSRNDITKKFLTGDINLIFPIRKNDFPGIKISYSDNVYSQILHIASNKENIRNIEALSGKTIYILRNTGIKKSIKKKLRDSNIIANVEVVNDLKKYSDQIIIDSSSFTHDLNYTFMIGKVPFTVFGYNGESPDLLNKINKALEKKYLYLFNNHKEKVEQTLRKEKFFNSLTTEEKKYLENLKEINIAYEENSTVSHYIPESKSYGGILPLVWDEIAKDLDLKLNIINKSYEGWDKILSRFENGEIKSLGVANFPGRENKYIFSNKLTDIHTYKIYKSDYKENVDSKIGVIKESVEDYISKEYYLSKNIIRYKNKMELIDALKKGEVKSILHVNPYLSGVSGYNSEIFYSFPINLAFNKEDIIFKNIFDKAYMYLVDKDLLKEKSIESDKRFSALKVKEAEYLRGLLYRGVLLFLIFLVFVLGVFFIEKRKKAKDLEKIAFFDILSTLGNRYNFNNACEEFESKSGVCIVVDLDNFKNANDTFGHSVGDEIIKECGMLLKNIFGEKNTFRISGDEYYIFVSNENFQNQLNELKNTLERGYILKKYSISMSVGYFFKTFETSILEGFKKADTGMYRAKKISGNSFYCEK